MKQFWIILKRALLLRCPRCGKGKIFRRRFTTYENCSVCHLVFEREEGFYTGAIAINLIVSELLITALDRKSTPLNSSHQIISYAVFCFEKKKNIPSSHR